MEHEHEERGVFFPALMGGIIGGLMVAGLFAWFGDDEVKAGSAAADTYAGEVATRVSPVEVRGWLESEDTTHVVVDVRSAADYERGHIVGAYSIPASSMTDEMLVEAFKMLPDGKTPVLYCYSASCMLAPKTADRLARAGIEVMHMTIGWNEWRYDWKMWNGQFVTTSPLTYSAVGAEPGVYNGPKTKTGCAADGGEGGC